jgi:hypothetical protein
MKTIDALGQINRRIVGHVRERNIIDRCPYENGGTRTRVRSRRVSRHGAVCTLRPVLALVVRCVRRPMRMDDHSLPFRVRGGVRGMFPERPSRRFAASAHVDLSPPTRSGSTNTVDRVIRIVRRHGDAHRLWLRGLVCDVRRRCKGRRASVRARREPCRRWLLDRAYHLHRSVQPYAPWTTGGFPPRTNCGGRRLCTSILKLARCDDEAVVEIDEEFAFDAV